MGKKKGNSAHKHYSKQGLKRVNTEITSNKASSKSFSLKVEFRPSLPPGSSPSLPDLSLPRLLCFEKLRNILREDFEFVTKQ